MNLRSIHWIWLLLVVASLGLGGGAAWLLHEESLRIRGISDRLLAEKEASIRESLSIVVSETQSGLMDSLAAFPVESLESNLGNWADSNPFVESTFIRRARGTLTYFSGADPTMEQELSAILQPEEGSRTMKSSVPEKEEANVGGVGESQVGASLMEPSARLREEADENTTQDEVLEEAPLLATSNLMETRERVRRVTKDAYYEQRAIQQQSADRDLRNSAEMMPSAPAVPEVSIDGGGYAEERGWMDAPAPEKQSRSDKSMTAADASPDQEQFSVQEDTPAGPEPEPIREEAWGKIQEEVVEEELPESSLARHSEWEWVQLGGRHVLVGQFQPYRGAPIRGLLVDGDELFRALVSSLPGNGTSNGGPRLVVQTRQRSLQPESSTGLYRTLPSAIFPETLLFLPRESGDVFNRSFWVVSGMMIVVLLTAFLFGGTVLLILARRSAVDAMQKTDFLSNISHELKTPLTTIRMYAEMLEEGRVEDVCKQRRYFQTIGGETERLSRLVNNILQYSALQKGKSRLRTERLDLNALIHSVCESQEIRFEEASMRLLVSLPDATIEVESDPDAVEQALINLFDNAIKYAAEGGEVTCRLSEEAGMARITVEDLGPGIPRNQRMKIFDAFHRVDDSLTTSKPGSGLGLCITQSLFRQLGGDLVYEPNEPRGSRFHLILPMP